MPTSPAMWAAGIDQMLDGKHKLELPLGNHNYLRAIVFGLADQADAVAERKKEADVRVGRHRQAASENVDPLSEKLAWLKTQKDYGAITSEQYDEQVREAREGRKA